VKTKIMIMMSQDTTTAVGLIDTDIQWMPVAVDMDMSKFTPARAVFKEITFATDDGRFMRFVAGKTIELEEEDISIIEGA
jgi:hypothetical protein